jgi:hypothetical protein
MSGDELPKDFNECVSQEYLQAVVHKVNKDIEEIVIKVVTQVMLELKLANQLERLDRRISDLTVTVATLEARPAPAPDKDANGSNDDDLDVYDVDGNLDNMATMQNKLKCRLQINTQGMGGARHNHHHLGNHNRASDDPYAKVKFTIPSFDRHYDAEAYLDWEMTIEQKFSAHQVPEEHRVRQATSEFKGYAIIW